MSKLTSSQKHQHKKYFGEEPVVTAASSDADMHLLYNWYHYLYDNEDAKDFLLEYLKKKKPEYLPHFSGIPSHILRNSGWNSRAILNGSILPASYQKRFEDKLDSLVKDKFARRTEVKETEDGEKPAPTRNIQDFIRERASELNGELEGAFDDLFLDKTIKTFDASHFMKKNEVSAPVARIIITKFNKHYDTAFDQQKGKVEMDFKPAEQKRVVQFYRDIVVAAEERISVAKAKLKPKKKKEKPKSVIVAKVQFQLEDKELGLASINPTEIVGAQQAWVYNTKTKKLAVYYSLATAGLSVKGTSITGYDKTSVMKTLRKPKEQLKPVMDGGKLVLRKVMDGIKAKGSEPSPRLNKSSLILRVLK
jgi:hypothetical protein